MDKLHNLFIRATKSSNPERNVEKLYKRFYHTPHGDLPLDYMDYQIAQIFLVMNERYHFISTFDLAVKLNPRSDWRYDLPEGYSYETKLKKVLISAARLSKISLYEGFKKSAKWKRS